MSKEEFLKIQTCVLKVNIHCDGCKQKVKRILQKIEGVYTTKIDSEQGKVTVSGNVDPLMLIKKLTKNGKHAELWGAAATSDNGKGGVSKGQGVANNQPKGGGNKGQVVANNQPKSGGNKGQGVANNQPKSGGNPQLQQIKGFQDLKFPPQFMKDMKMPMPVAVGKDPKSVKFNLPEEDDGMSDDEFDDDDDDYYDDEFDDDEMDDLHPPVGKMMKPVKPVVGGNGMPNMFMQGMMNGGQLAQLGNGGGNNGGNAKKGGGNVPIQMNFGGSDGKSGGGVNGGKKGGSGNGNGNINGGNQNHGGGNSNGGGQNKNGNNGNNFNPNVAKKGGENGMMPNMMPMGGGMRNMPMGHMQNAQMGQMSNLAAVQGLPAPTMSGNAGGGAGYFQSAPAGAGPIPGNPYYQQQMAAMMMNQQHANGNERFQPMMYARPPPAVNYMPPYPYPYPYPPPPGDRIDQYSMFSDENTSSCSMM